MALSVPRDGCSWRPRPLQCKQGWSRVGDCELAALVVAEHGVAVASARAGNVIGGGDWSRDRLVPDCMRAFAQGKAVRVRNPHATRQWQHVLDSLCGYLLLAEALLAGSEAAQAWNFGPSTDNVASVGDVVHLLVAHWGGGASWNADPGPHPHEAGLLAWTHRWRATSWTGGHA